MQIRVIKDGQSLNYGADQVLEGKKNQDKPIVK